MFFSERKSYWVQFAQSNTRIRCNPSAKGEGRMLRRAARNRGASGDRWRGRAAWGNGAAESSEAQRPTMQLRCKAVKLQCSCLRLRSFCCTTGYGLNRSAAVTWAEGVAHDVRWQRSTCIRSSCLLSLTAVAPLPHPFCQQHNGPRLHIVRRSGSEPRKIRSAGTVLRANNEGGRRGREAGAGFRVGWRHDVLTVVRLVSTRGETNKKREVKT